jgi:hypothetical protein
MPGEFHVYTESFKASADLSALQDTFVKLTAANTVGGAGAGEKGVGVLKNAPSAAGRPARVAVLGICEVKVNGASPNIAAGDWIKVGALGVGVQSTTAKDIVMGIANMAATADGVIIEILLTGPHTLSI